MKVSIVDTGTTLRLHWLVLVGVAPIYLTGTYGLDRDGHCPQRKRAGLGVSVESYLEGS